jgi:hypothetical protein
MPSGTRFERQGGIHLCARDMRLCLIFAAAFIVNTLANRVLGQVTAHAPAVVTLYTGFLDPLPQQPVSGFSVRQFKLRTMHALVDKAKSLQSVSLRVLHVEVPMHHELMKRCPTCRVYPLIPLTRDQRASCQVRLWRVHRVEWRLREPGHSFRVCCRSAGGARAAGGGRRRVRCHPCALRLGQVPRQDDGGFDGQVDDTANVRASARVACRYI